MARNISDKEKKVLCNKLTKANVEIEKQIAYMINVLEKCGDKNNTLKLKQALLSFRIVYNRAKLKLEK